MDSKIAWAVLLTGLFTSTCAMALETLADNALSQVSGAGGADISLDLRWNLSGTNSGGDVASDYTYSCPNGDVWCRVGLSANNRLSASSMQEWIVLKGMRGDINIPKLGIDSAAIQYMNGTTQVNTMALKLTFNNTIKLRNFGFDAIALATDTSTTPGYLQLNKYTSGQTFYKPDGSVDAVVGAYDAGHETGFLGLNINANVNINGSIKVYACPAGVC